MFNTDQNSVALQEDQVEKLLVLPALEESVAAQVTNTVTTGSHRVRFPRLTADPTAQWTHEGEEIDPSDPKVEEVITEPEKVAGLVIVSSEMFDDSESSVIEQIGAGLVRQIINSIDQAFFTALDAPAPPGLTHITPSELTIDGALTNLDWAEEALALAASNQSSIDTFVCNPGDALALAKLKESTGSNRGLLQIDPTQPASRTIAGVPLMTTNYIEPGTIWGIPKTTTHTVVRKGAEVKSDASALFTSDKIAIRGIMRVGFAFPHEAGIIKINHNDQ